MRFTQDDMGMSSERLQVCFQALHSTGELVLTGGCAGTLDEDPLRCAWAAAEADTALAYNELFGATVNPHDVTRSAGGSG